MPRYQIITLVDITRSQAHRSETDRIKVGQQANFNSLIQAIGIRANPSWYQDPKMHTGRLPLPLTGKCNHWTWEFDIERDDIYKKDDDPVALLKEDLHGVPIIDQLNNSADIHPSAFQTEGKNPNTWICILE
jgi:hypothetical protein